MRSFAEAQYSLQIFGKILYFYAFIETRFLINCRLRNLIVISLFTNVFIQRYSPRRQIILNSLVDRLYLLGLLLSTFGISIIWDFTKSHQSISISPNFTSHVDDFVCNSI